MGADIFNVLTEFRFDAGQAILESDKLQDAVHGISGAVDKLNLGFMRLGEGIVGHMDLLHGGLIGGLLKAIEVSDKFNLTASGFANIIQANMKHMIGNVDTFNERLEVSKQVLGDVHKVAAKFGLDEMALLGAAQGLSATLAPAGLSGKNFDKSIDMARMSLKAAPTLQMEPRNVEQELIRIVTGQANSNETLFRRLVSDTEALHKFQLSGTGSFNALPIAKRVELVTKALNEFSRDTEVAEFNMRSLHNQLTLLKNAFTGFASVLKPIGDLILPIVQKVLMTLNKYIENEGRQAIENVAKMFEPLTKNPMRQVETGMQLKRLPHDIHITTRILESITALTGLEWVLGLVGIKFQSLTWIMHQLHKVIPEGPFIAIMNGIKAAFTSGEGLAYGFGLVGGAIAKAAGIMFSALGSVIFILQIVSRAFAIAKISDMKFIAEHMAQVTDIFAKFSTAISKIIEPISNGIEVIAGWVAWIFTFGKGTEMILNLFESMANWMTTLANIFVMFESTIAGVAAAMGNIVGSIQTGNFKGLMNTKKAFDEAQMDYLAKNLIQDKSNKSSVVQNIGQVVIRNDFKENMQPDRVAFTIADQLKKVAQNSTQGRNVTLASHALTGGVNQ